MAYTVTKLITGAYYASGIVSREFSTVTGSQFEDGLMMLNEIISDKTVEEDMIPYFTKYDFTSNAGKQTTFIPNLIQSETATFFIDGVRYEMTQLQRRRYWGSSRADNVQSLPFTYEVERVVGGANLNLYFIPNQNYTMQLWGLFRLSQVEINQDLTSRLTTVELGAVTVNGAGTLAIGQFLINGTDMAGAYATPQALAVAINNAQDEVRAQVFLGSMTLTSADNIVISTTGQGNPVNTINFVNFNLIDGFAKNQEYFPMVLDQFYITYLKYALANRLCYEFDYGVPPGVEKQLTKYESMISKKSQQIDLRMEKVSTLGTGTGINYGQVNLGHGWTI